MGIGASIILIALGAILGFATNLSVAGVDLHAVGIILMIAGALGLVMTLLLFRPRRPTGPTYARQAAYRPHAEQYPPPPPPGHYGHHDPYADQGAGYPPPPPRGPGARY